MSIRHQIHYLRNQQIDKKKWDACIDSAPNGLIYGCSFYLDHMAKHWDALVLNDYEAVMPLTWNKKWGIRYLYQPFLCASLGLFGKSLSDTIMNQFLQNIPPNFKYIDIRLNHGNHVISSQAHISEMQNFILDLNRDYDTLYNHFSDNVKRNIKKALQAGCTICKPDFDIIFKLAKIQLKEVITASKDDYTRFSKLYNYLQEKKISATYGIQAANGQLLSSCIFFFWKKRAYYILVGNHPKGKATGSSHALINAFIKEHAKKSLILDFEGSDVPGLASFYKSFGGMNEPYLAIKRNLLPPFIRWMKP